MVSIVLAIVLVAIFMIVGNNADLVIRDYSEVIENFNNPNIMSIDDGVDVDLICGTGDNLQLSIKDFKINYKLSKKTYIDVTGVLFGKEFKMLKNPIEVPMKTDINELLLPIDKTNFQTTYGDVVLTLLFWKQDTDVSCYALNKGRSSDIILEKCPNSYMGSADIIIPIERWEGATKTNKYDCLEP